MGCNRDESRRRPEALPPQLRRFADRSAVMPIDPVSDGTWIAVNDAGVVMSLLNHYPPGPPVSKRPEHLSRGTIIPFLLDQPSARSAASVAMGLDPARYPPFRLVIADLEEVIELRHAPSGIERGSTARVLRGPFLFVSSGLGDGLVEGPRRELFDQWFGSGEEDSAARQEAFHVHSWPDQPHLSVCMSRPEARTVSFTAVELSPCGAMMRYWPITDAGRGALTQLRLALQ